MIILLLVITILMMVLIGVFDGDGDMLGAICIVIFFPLLIALTFCCYKLTSFRIIDDKIKLYEEQNNEIEEKVELVVKQYMSFETNTYKELKSDSYITLANLYPDLKSDTMVQQQIELYTKNNKKITELKEKKLNKTIYKWWIYFGK